VDYGPLQAEIDEFPCIFPRNREKAHRDEFADDCLHRQMSLKANSSMVMTRINPHLSTHLKMPPTLRELFVALRDGADRSPIIKVPPNGTQEAPLPPCGASSLQSIMFVLVPQNFRRET